MLGPPEKEEKLAAEGKKKKSHNLITFSSSVTDALSCALVSSVSAPHAARLTLHWSPCGGFLLRLRFAVCRSGNSGRGFDHRVVVHVGTGAADVHACDENIAITKPEKPYRHGGSVEV